MKLSSIGQVVSEEKMFENVEGRTDDGVTGILIAHLGAFGSGELKIGDLPHPPKKKNKPLWHKDFTNFLFLH